MIVKTYNVLILDTTNSATSIMAEALFNTMGNGVYKAYSAGFLPAVVANRFALEEIKSTTYPISKLKTKNWDEYAQPNAPLMNFIITVCDTAAKQSMPTWPGKPMFLHWSFKDPLLIEGSFEEKKAAFKTTFEMLQQKIELFTELPLAHLNQKILNARIAEWD
jgi:arsenate reductase